MKAQLLSKTPRKFVTYHINGFYNGIVYTQKTSPEFWQQTFLTHLFPVHSFSNPWKHQKSVEITL